MCFIISCSNDTKKPGLIKDPNETSIMAFYEANPHFYNSPTKFYSDSSHDFRAFLNKYYKEFETEFFQDSLKYTVYYGNNGMSGHPYRLVVIKFKGSTAVLPIDLDSAAGDEEAISAELSKLLKPIRKDENESKIDKTAQLIAKIISNVKSLNPFHLEDTTNLRIQAIKNQCPYTYGTAKCKFKESRHTRYFWEKLYTIQDSLLYFNHPPNNPTNKYLIFRDEYWQIYLFGITEDAVNFEFFNPSGYKHLYL